MSYFLNNRVHIFERYQNTSGQNVFSKAIFCKFHFLEYKHNNFAEIVSLSKTCERDDLFEFYFNLLRLFQIGCNEMRS